MKPKVKIGITTKNRFQILSKAIESGLSQDYENMEVVVFDDGSTDETPTLRAQYRSVTWVRKETSVGLLEARNEMMKAGDAVYFVSLDDDAWFLENDEVSKAVELMEQHQNCAAIAFDILQRDTRRFKKVPRSAPFETNIYIGCGHMLRLDRVKEAGHYVPFPVKYGHEEKDLAIRMMDAGYTILFAPGLHVWHDYTQMARNLDEQNKSFIINDLVYPFRRVPLIYLLPVLLNKIYRKLKSTAEVNKEARSAVLMFFKLIPGQLKYVDRVRRSTYLHYRQISEAYLKFLDENDQSKN